MGMSVDKSGIDCTAVSVDAVNGYIFGNTLSHSGNDTVVNFNPAVVDCAG